MYTDLKTIEEETMAWKPLDYPFLFSFVIAVYNVEDYIDEAMESLICQDIGFENIQIILVDDGSTDTSGEICDRYAQQYPENIIALHKENGGAASARNFGLTKIQGQYVGFMDSDDKLSPNTCKEVFYFFEKHSGEIDLVAIPMKFFGAKGGNHPLNYKFNHGTRVVDLHKNYDYVHISIAASFVTHKAAAQIHMDEKLMVNEDGKAILELLLRKPFMGVVSNVAYYYRKRQNETVSLSSNLIFKKKWYLPSLEEYTEKIFSEFEEEWGYIPEFVQFTTMYELQWRIKTPRIPFGVLTDEEKQIYWDKLLFLLRKIKEPIIQKQRSLNDEWIRLMLDCRYGEQYELAPDLSAQVLTARYKKHGAHQRIDFIDLKSTTITIEGRFDLPIVETRPIVMVAELDGKKLPCDTFLLGPANMVADHPLSNTYGFCFRFSLRPDVWQHKVTFFLHPGDDWVRISKFSYPRHCVFGKNYSNSYSWPRKRRRITESKGTLLFSRSEERVRFRMEKCLLRQLWRQNKAGERKAVLARLGRTLWKKTEKKTLWIIMDRPDRAGDSGEALFRYINEKYSSEVRACFALREDSPDFTRMQQIGETLDPRSKKYKFLFLCCDVIVSSEALDEVTNPFGSRTGILSVKSHLSFCSMG